MALVPVDSIIGRPSVNAFSANTPVTQELPRKAIIEDLWLHLTGTLTNASYSVAPTAAAEGIRVLPGQVSVRATGNISETFKAADFDWFSLQTQLLEGTAPQLTDIGTANQAYIFEANAKVSFRGQRWTTPLATLLDARLLTDLELTIQWRDVQALVSGGTGGTSTLSGVQAVCIARQLFGTDPAKTPAFGYLKESQKVVNIAATQLGFEVDNLPTGNYIRRMAFRGFVGANQYSDPSDALFASGVTDANQNIAIKDSQFYPWQTKYFPARSRDKQRYQAESLPSGIVTWEPSAHGLDTEQYNAVGKNDLSALVDVTATGGKTNTLTVVTVEHVTPQLMATRR